MIDETHSTEDDFGVPVPVVKVPIVLSEDQENAKGGFINFLLSPIEQVFVLEGYAGVGKSTLVEILLDNMNKYLDMAKLVNPAMPKYEVALTATTNKAAEALSQITGRSVITIHSFLGLRVSKDFITGETELIPKDDEKLSGYILIIDEASMIDSKLLNTIFSKLENCKVMFIGDPAQLPPVKSTRTPVFDAGFKTAKLTKVMRQAEGNPIIQLATKFRETVTSGKWFNFKPDGEHIIHLNQSDFEDAIVAEFTRKDWKYTDSKVLAWTNATVMIYNHAITNLLTGAPHFNVGDYAVCNKRVQVGNKGLKTDQMTFISDIEPMVEYKGVIGNWVTLDHVLRCFFPKSLEAKAQRVKEAKALKDYQLLKEIEDQWVDLRPNFAQTLNKSQGSTYDRVFIDLDDVSRCNMGDLIARLLYVGTSRARHQVFFKGDFG